MTMRGQAVLETIMLRDAETEISEGEIRSLSDGKGVEEERG